MEGRLTGVFITLADLYVAYRKAKVEAFYENTHFHALAFTEYEQNLHKNLNYLHQTLMRPGFAWMSDLKFIGDFAYLPKSIDSKIWESEIEGHFRALDPLIDWKQRFCESTLPATAKFRLIIRPTVNFQIVSALWIIKVGHLFDGVIKPTLSYGNRLRRSQGDFGDPRVNAAPLNLTATGLFVPYFSAYRTWRENGLSAMEKSLEVGKSVLAITMDIEQFYHRVSPNFLLRKKFLDSLSLKLSRQETLFTKALLNAIDCWYKSTPDYVERPDGGIPVGLSASKIIANVLLSNFDNDLVGRLKPIYYGRYVDDIFLVYENTESLTTGRQVTEQLAEVMRPELVLKGNGSDIPSLELSLPYAKDSQLVFAGKKQKVFALSSSHGLDLIQHIRENIRVQSSEYRLLPNVPTTGVRMASKALLATPDATLQVDALRKADVVSVKRLGVSLLLRDLESYSTDLRPESWGEVRTEFYALVKRHVLTPTGFFDFFGYLPRVFGLMLANGDIREAGELIENLVEVAQLIELTTTAGETANLLKFKLCLGQYAKAFLQTGLQAATERTLVLDRKYLKVLHKIQELDPDTSIPATLPKLKTCVHHILLADWGRRPYKNYWYLSQDDHEKGPPVPRQLEIRKKIRLGGIRRFRRAATLLKAPYWPALAFPTRPLRIDEIALVAPTVLSDPRMFKRAILVLRGAKVATNSNLGFEPTKDIGEDEPVAFNVPRRSNSPILTAITSYETKEEQWATAAKGHQDRSLDRYINLNELVNRILRESKKPDYIVFPELSIPLRWAMRVARKLAENGISLLAGVEYHKDRVTGRLRNDSLISLVTDWPGYNSHIVRLQPKFSPAHSEKTKLRDLKIGKRSQFFEPCGLDAKATIYIHGGFCFSVLICSDLTNINHRYQLRGKVDALFALEWNPDTKTFSSLVESTANDLHAYVAQINNRTYGDSRLRVPAVEDYLRDVVQVKGGASDYYVLGDIDYLGLRREQSRFRGKRKFKPVPIGYKASLRRKNRG